MNSPASILFDINGNPVGVSGSMPLPTGSIGQLLAGVDQSGNVRYLNFISSSIMVTGSLGLVGSSIVTGSIAVSNFPSVQVVTGSVLTIPTGTQTVAGTVTSVITGTLQTSVTNFPAVQTVTGSVSITGQPVTVNGTVNSVISGTLTVTTTGSLPVSILNIPTVTGSVGITNFPIVQTITGTVALTAQPIIITTTGSLPTLHRRSSLASTSSVNASNSTSQILLSSSLNRLQGLVFNDSTGQLYVTLGSSSSTTSFTVRLDSRGYYEIPIYYIGVVSGIWSNNNGAARMTEINL